MGVSVDVGVEVGVFVDVDVDVDVGVDVNVDVGVEVGVFVDVDVGVRVGVEVGVFVDVDVDVNVDVDVGVRVGVEVGVFVGVGVRVGVEVGVFVDVGVGVPPAALTFSRMSDMEYAGTTTCAELPAALSVCAGALLKSSDGLVVPLNVVVWSLRALACAVSISPPEMTDPLTEMLAVMAAPVLLIAISATVLAFTRPPYTLSCVAALSEFVVGKSVLPNFDHNTNA